MAKRQSQVESVLQKAISQVLTRDISDPRIAVPGIVSVTGVDVSPDLKAAKVFISVVPEKYQKRVIAGLKHASGRIRGLVLKRVRMRGAPRFEFQIDESIKREAEVLEAINEGMRRSGLVGEAGEAQDEVGEIVTEKPDAAVGDDSDGEDTV